MRNIFFILFLFVMLIGCRGNRQLVQQTTTDSTVVSFREVEKIIHIPGDTVSASMQVSFHSPASVPGDSIIAPVFTPQTQTIETKRTKVRIELTQSGEIKATAISKELDEKVVVLEKTTQNYKSETTEYQQKESFLAKAKASAWRWIKGILFLLLLVAVIATAIKVGLNPISILKKFFTKS